MPTLPARPDRGKGGRTAAAVSAVVVFSLADALAAAAAAEAAGRPLTLVSAPAAGLAAGPGWFAALARRVGEHHPAADLIWVLDCADSPGAVLAALRAGVADIAVAPAALTPALEGLAAAAGARLHAGRPDAADLRGHRDAPAALARLLALDATR